MVLVDTSVWVRFFHGREPYARELSRLLNNNEVAAHEMIYGELMIGDPGGGRALLRAFQQVRYLKTIPHRLVIALVQDRALHGRGAGWVDVHLIASALAESVPFWTADLPLQELAEHLRIGYRPK